ncbi:hypothetical protein J8F10_11740 [Gemmata sp. G18]|uniref:Uncharacterized protein n=1 Tax=Gemmata palustris TaxID=2822762 RepID=A0ABS5BQE7_9BACT|nr:hypothetical protein [Gemmata palustris]MBP3955957.1 hypothetical protein [Gemmata palustris]
MIGLSKCSIRLVIEFGPLGSLALTIDCFRATKNVRKGIGVANTARNWNTVLKLHELAKKAAETE